MVRTMGGPCDPRVLSVEDIGTLLRMVVQPFGCADEYRYAYVNDDSTMAEASYQRTVGTGPQLRAYREALQNISRSRVFMMKTKRKHGRADLPVRPSEPVPAAERTRHLPASALRRGGRGEG